MLNINSIHHIAIICSNYEASKKFYTGVLGFTIKKETYRAERASYKLDLMLNEEYIIELFSFPNPAPRPTRPEAMGLRHLAFEVDNLDEAIEYLKKKGVNTEGVRIDEITNKRFTFFNDPDNLPLEFYEK